MTVYQHSERKALVIDAQMTSPSNFQLPVENLTDVKRGPLAVAVPGFLKGLWEIHRKHGSVSWRELVEPTLALCRDGIVITKHFHDSININRAITSDPYLNELLVDRETKNFKRPGSTVHIGKNCGFLDLLANHTESEIYSGAIGDVIAKDFEDAGSRVTLTDLKDYEVRTSKPLEYPISDETKLFVPNTGAVLLIPSVLNILRKYELNGSVLDDVENINETILAHHQIIEAFKHIFAARSKLGDSEFVDVKTTVERLLSSEFADFIRSRIDDSRTQEFNRYTAEFLSPEEHGTSHLSIIAEIGDSISATSSINY